MHAYPTSLISATYFPESPTQAALSELRASRTTLIVAHRLSTVVDANTIIVMEAGSVKERGDHAELLAQGGLYAEMWSKQAQGTTPVRP